MNAAVPILLSCPNAVNNADKISGLDDQTLTIADFFSVSASSDTVYNNCTNYSKTKIKFRTSLEFKQHAR